MSAEPLSHGSVARVRLDAACVRLWQLKQVAPFVRDTSPVFSAELTAAFQELVTAAVRLGAELS